MGNALQALNEWLRKAAKGSMDWLYDDESRETKHKKLLREYGFPEEEDIVDAREDDDGQPPSEHEAPWIKNESGTNYDEDVEPEDRIVEHKDENKLKFRV